MSAMPEKYLFPRLFLILALVLLSNKGEAQHNGDPLLFQGLENRASTDAKGSAYGNAFVSRSNDLNSIFYNPAGLADISSVQVSVSSHYQDYLIRDNQYFVPSVASSGGYTALNLYLSHVIIPDPAWNNIWSDSLRIIWYDSLGNPIGANWWDPNRLRDLPQDQSDYSEDAAVNQKKKNMFAFDHIAMTIPFDFMEKRFVAAVSYNRQFSGYNYDWNGAHFSPHWGMVAGDVGAINDTVKDDIVRSNWSVFTRERTDGVHALTGALAFKVDNHFQIGGKVQYLMGETHDTQALQRIGYFRFKNGFGNSSWSFSYDTHDSLVRGNSKIYGMMFNFGVIYNSPNFNLGLNIQLPYRMERAWSYSTQVSTRDSVGNLSLVSSAIAGRDYVTLPVVIAGGITVKNINDLTLSLEYESNPLSSATYELTSIPDSLFTQYQKWVDQTSLRFGVEYAIADGVSVLGGYQVQGAPFIGYAVADKEQGAPIDKYSCGLSLSILDGRLDIAYLYSQLKYYDVYMSNRNFTLERSQSILFGYTYSF
ncbi:MAG: hypothetical protein WBD36_03190 [Bacteroidota bacterium]